MPKKTTKKQQVIEFLRANPLLSLADVAQVFGTTNQYVSLVQQMEPGLADERESAKDKFLEKLGAKMRPFGPKQH